MLERMATVISAPFTLYFQCQFICRLVAEREHPEGNAMKRNSLEHDRSVQWKANLNQSESSKFPCSFFLRELCWPRVRALGAHLHS